MPKIIENPREIILSSAKNIIYNEGYDNMTMRRISEECGIGLGTLYNYFPNKIAIAIQLMQNFWNDYLLVVDEIDSREIDFFFKIRCIYKEMESFVNIFMEMLSRMNSVKLKECKKEEQEGRKAFSEKLVNTLEGMLNRYSLSDGDKLVSDINNQELAKFIVQNLVMMSHMKEFDYRTFEKILKKLLT